MDSAPVPRSEAPEDHGSEPRAAAPFAAARPLAALPAPCRRSGVRRLDLFGSAKTERFDSNRSDLDFLVSFDDLTPPGAYADAWFGPCAASEDLIRAAGEPPDRSGTGEPASTPPSRGGAALVVPGRSFRRMTAVPSGKHLRDAWRTAERVSRLTAGKGFGDHRSDGLLRGAVERQPGFVGEALAALRRAGPAPPASSSTATPRWTTG